MRVSLHPGVTLTPIDEVAVLLDERTGRYRQLNATATLVLRSLLAGHGPAGAARELVRTYPDATPTAEADIAALVERLRAANLIVETADGEQAR
ncbi:lasso peptide biosynthesis PqqD family chaperone [Nonomuraea sp. NPDC050202]|uniref:lasso peptide biosynthesis PqqD family chaperone n=1 Tax=Nonomuraea sp. NPDC050202 TaxID=3155035 RepID=UPI0033C95096